MLPERALRKVVTVHDLAEIVAYGLVYGLIYVAVGSGLSVSMGLSRVMNIAHGALIILGAYLAWDMEQVLHVPILVALLVCLVGGGLAGIVLHLGIGYHALFRNEQASLVALFGAAVISTAVLTEIWSGDLRAVNEGVFSGRVTVAGVGLSTGLIWGAVAGIVLWVLYVGVLRLTGWGRVARAVGESEIGALVCGIDARRSRTVAFVAGCAIACASGWVLSMAFPFSPDDYIEWLGIAFIVVIIGGSGRVTGLLVGGLVTGLLQALVEVTIGLKWSDLAVYGLMFAILAISGQGVAGLSQRQI